MASKIPKKLPTNPSSHLPRELVVQITQSSVATIARDLGFDYQVGNILRSDLYTCDEAFLTGTAAEVVPVRSVDDREVGTGGPGPMTRKIQETYFAAVRGEVDRYKDWLEHVNV